MHYRTEKKQNGDLLFNLEQLIKNIQNISHSLTLSNNT